MGSIRFTRIAVPLSIAALALIPAVGAAAPIKDYSMNGATGEVTPQHTYKDYSKNGATGDYAPTAPTTAPTTVAVVHEQSSFSWGAAAIGGAATLIIVMLAGMTSRRVRRRHVGAPSPARPSAA
jgi:hypothetical protein